ncbi:glycosyltransferase [Bacteroidales bacterium OttesenSCG-928-M11]|nr:glycosyltransferase [Bacteroidales bacterium OttesenSCG-928-M11]
MLENTKIKVSIVTPSFNQGQFIEKTIQSVLDQTYDHIEYIIIDGGSTDETLSIVEKYKDRIDIVISEKDKGQSDAINKGFRLATGTLVGWINSDDILYPHCVEELVNAYTKNPDGAVYFCPKLDIIDESGNLLETHNRPITDRNYLLKQNYSVNQPTSFYSNAILQKINYLDETIHYCMDLDLWVRLLEHGPIYPLSQVPQGAIRRWEGTKTSTQAYVFLREIKKTLKKYQVKPYDKSLLCANYIQLKIFLINAFSWK